MNTPEAKPLSTHSAERTLYQVQVRRRKYSRPDILLYDKLIGTEWEPLRLGERRYKLTEHLDTMAEIEDGLFPYALAMREAWEVLACEHGFIFDVRLVPHVVKTSYASYPQEPLMELDRNPQ